MALRDNWQSTKDGRQFNIAVLPATDTIEEVECQMGQWMMR